jgi:hypothetical protein
MATSKRDWRGTYVEGQQKVYVERHSVFGWYVHQHILPVGSKLVISSSKNITRSEATNIAMYVRGNATITNPNLPNIPNRVPGLFTDERPDHPEGITTITPLVETEMWCLNYITNRYRLPKITPIRIESAGVLTPQTGSKILVCRGNLNNYYAADSFISDGTTLSSEGNTYGFIIGEKNV